MSFPGSALVGWQRVRFSSTYAPRPGPASAPRMGVALAALDGVNVLPVGRLCFGILLLLR
jgi:hypothetical protein